MKKRVKFDLVVILVCGLANLNLIAAEPFEEGAPDSLIQGEFKDPILSMPDNEVWASSGSGSGLDDKPEDEAKIDQPNHDIEGTVRKIQKVKILKPKIEAKAHEVEVESDENTHHVEAESKKVDGSESKGVNYDSSMPKFNSIAEELKWKFNKARNSLKQAKQYVKLAYLTAAKKHRGTKSENEVKNIITKTEVALVHAGEKMGLDYVHYK